VTATRQFFCTLALPYIRRELPGWGALWSRTFGDYKFDPLWQGAKRTVVRGKLHGQLMELDLCGWSNRTTYALGRFYDLPTQLLVATCLDEGDLFVDIGGNEGMISLVAAAAVGATGRVIAFEPNPVPRAKFQRNLEINELANVQIIAAGAADAPATLTLFVPDVNTGEGSFALTDADGRSGRSISCPVVTADSVLEGLPPRLIKMDVEGFEGFAIEGLRQTLTRARPVLVLEMVESHAERSGISVFEICRRLAAQDYCGFHLGLAGGSNKGLTLTPLSNVPDQGAWQDGDYVWIAREQADQTVRRLSGATLAEAARKLGRTAQSR
jgi:FkbM family methyltransferase